MQHALARSFTRLAAIALPLVALACSESSTTAPSTTPLTPPFTEQAPEVRAVSVSGTAPVLGGSAQAFTATATLSTGGSTLVTSAATWQSSDAAVVTVTTNGAVAAVSAGTAVVSATYRGVTGSQTITVAPVVQATLFGIVSRAGSSPRPVVGATVTISDGQNAGRTTTTDGNGYYSLGQLLVGTFSLRVTKSGYETVSRSVSLSSDTRLDLSAALEISAPTTPTPAPAPNQPTPSPGPTFLRFSGDAGDFISGGRSYSYVLSSGTWTATADYGDTRQTNRVSVRLTNFSASPYISWTLEFKAPGAQPLTVGTYANARRYPFQGAQPGFSLSGDGRGCNTLTATFDVQELVLGPLNSVDRFRATFEQHCEGGSTAARGEVSIANNPWR